MVDLEDVWAAIGRERQLRQDLATYQTNVYIRRVEADEEHEARLRQEIERAHAKVDELISERRREFAQA